MGRGTIIRTMSAHPIVITINQTITTTITGSVALSTPPMILIIAGIQQFKDCWSVPLGDTWYSIPVRGFSRPNIKKDFHRGVEIPVILTLSLKKQLFPSVKVYGDYLARFELDFLFEGVIEFPFLFGISHFN